MKLCIVGSGYVGLVAGACLADSGNEVICVDADKDKVDLLNGGGVPIYEPGLEGLIGRNRAKDRLHFTADLAEGLAAADIIFVAVGTPEEEDGSADLSHVLAVAQSIARQAKSEKLVVTKSTVPVGTADMIRQTLAAFSKLDHRVASNPEFLKEGAAISDFMRPDRIVIGTDDERSRTQLAEVYAPFSRREHKIIHMSVRSAELTKYAANAMLATRISFMNELANLCEVLGADIDEIRFGIGSDRRIGSSFLYPGCGYGGSCFPKDVKALAHTARERGMTLHIVEAAETVNAGQRMVPAAKLFGHLGDDLSGKRVAVWGLAFKANTDDLREAPALYNLVEIAAAGATVAAHDPVAIEAAAGRVPEGVTLVTDPYDALEGADALIIFTDWNDYRSPDLERMRAAMRKPLVIDGRNLLDPVRMAAAGFEYDSIGRPPG
jgi:UDPglucose 6-dehydrogenase